MNTRTHAVAIAAALALLPAAMAQTATLTASANGQPAVTVQPGEPVSIHVQITFAAGPLLAGAKGDLRITADAGTPSNFQFHLTGPLVNTGTFVGGSRPGIDIAATPPGFGQPSNWASLLDVLTYDVQFANPGVYLVAWAAPASAPNIRLFPTGTTASFVEAQTSYVGATITVLPTPPTLALLALTPLAARRRR